jgi:hypothetical protein
MIWAERITPPLADDCTTVNKHGENPLTGKKQDQGERKMNRQQMIDMLVSNALESVLNDTDRKALVRMLSKGYPGFVTKTDEQLAEEIKRRGLLPRHAEEWGDNTEIRDINDFEDDIDPEDEEFEESDDERLVMWSGMFHVEHV